MPRGTAPAAAARALRIEEYRKERLAAARPLLRARAQHIDQHAELVSRLCALEQQDVALGVAPRQVDRQSSSASQLPPNQSGNSSAAAMFFRSLSFSANAIRARSTPLALHRVGDLVRARRAVHAGARRVLQPLRGACPLLDDAPEAAVMIVSVVKLAARARRRCAARHGPSRPASSPCIRGSSRGCAAAAAPRDCRTPRRLCE